MTSPIRSGGELRVAPQQLAHDLDGHVVGARRQKTPCGPARPNAVRDAVDEHDLPTLPRRRVYAARFSSSAAQVLELPAVRRERLAVELDQDRRRPGHELPVAAGVQQAAIWVEPVARRVDRVIRARRRSANRARSPEDTAGSRRRARPVRAADRAGLPASRGRGRPTPWRSAFARASSTASGFVSVAQTSSVGRLTASATATAPPPVPTSATCIGIAVDALERGVDERSVDSRGVNTRPGAVRRARS